MKKPKPFTQDYLLALLEASTKPYRSYTIEQLKLKILSDQLKASKVKRLMKRIEETKGPLGI